VAGASTTRTYDVRDLVFPRTEHVPLGSNNPGKAPGTGNEVAWIKVDDLVANLKEATDPSYWQSASASIRGEDSGFVEVSASPGMHSMVQKVLKDIRSFASKSQ
jgi:hypothetical protein